jgi:hypothetical protein
MSNGYDKKEKLEDLGFMLMQFFVAILLSA